VTHPPVAEVFTAEVAIVGAGPAGLVSAIALAAAGVDTLLVAPPAQMDHRTTALLAGSVAALDTLGVWQRCVPQAAPRQKSIATHSGTISRTGISWRRCNRVPLPFL